MNIPLQGLLALYTYGLANLIIIRSTIAQSIALYALSFNIFGFIFLIILASTFHYSSVFAFSYYYIQRRNIFSLFIVILICFLLLINLDTIFGYLPDINNLEFVSSKIEFYFSSDIFESKGLSVFSFLQKSLLIYLVLKYREYVDSKFYGLSYLSLFGILLGILLNYNSVVLLRFAGYFEPFIYIFICILLSHSLKNIKNSLLLFICLILLITKFTYIIYYNYDLIIPYEFFFQDNFKYVY
jgi:hypothetical protein